MANKILLVVHQEHSVSGRVGVVLEELGYELDLRRPCLGQPLPESMDEHAGAVVFGGPMSANDCGRLPFIRTELDWCERVLKTDKPLLGICLGAQMLARVLGAKVGPHPDGWHEIGYYRLQPTVAGADLFTPGQHVYQWHGEGAALPAGATLLARSELFENQAFRYGAAYGLQFHPDVTPEMLQRWTRTPAHRMVLPGAQARDTQLAGNRLHNPGVERWTRAFLSRWLGCSTPMLAAAGD